MLFLSLWLCGAHLSCEAWQSAGAVGPAETPFSWQSLLPPRCVCVGCFPLAVTTWAPRPTIAQRRVCQPHPDAAAVAEDGRGQAGESLRRAVRPWPRTRVLPFLEPLGNHFTSHKHDHLPSPCFPRETQLCDVEVANCIFVGDAVQCA